MLVKLERSWIENTYATLPQGLNFNVEFLAQVADALLRGHP